MEDSIDIWDGSLPLCFEQNVMVRSIVFAFSGEGE